MNLKKPAKWKWKENNNPSKLLVFIDFLTNTKKKRFLLNAKSTSSTV